MNNGDIVKGHELELGMKVQRLFEGQPTQHPMIIFAEGPYYQNPLYRDDDFLLIEETSNED